MNIQYKNYYKTHSYNLENINYEISNKIFKRKIWKFIMILKEFKDLRVLEIWSWQWKFASYCKSIWIKNYTWLDLDDTIIEYTKKQFPEYSFFNTDVINFLSENKDKFDIVFMSHVFEHFSIDDWITLAELIKNNLSIDWIWFNFMPNWWSSRWNWLRYCDITHKTIYTITSFNQVLRIAWFEDKNVNHYSVIPELPIIAKIIYIILIYFPYYLIRKLTWINNIYTLEIFSLIKNKA